MIKDDWPIVSSPKLVSHTGGKICNLFLKNPLLIDALVQLSSSRNTFLMEFSLLALALLDLGTRKQTFFLTFLILRLTPLEIFKEAAQSLLTTDIFDFEL